MHDISYLRARLANALPFVRSMNQNKQRCLHAGFLETPVTDTCLSSTAVSTRKRGYVKATHAKCENPKRDKNVRTRSYAHLRVSNVQCRVDLVARHCRLFRIILSECPTNERVAGSSKQAKRPRWRLNRPYYGFQLLEPNVPNPGRNSTSIRP